ncbi:methylated-DNA--protein-cysteine methyltransferase-like [Galleria mellonella]|uniref:Methylated-DNA--protein-cysteine methyltransferase n=1 Tax=Galleria mellonella TaxID=7137 RepID=A0ABM3MQ63_GALME|nr:methylated-DNA--protein-cysteine methyltransferase-like [Galleria mellonella]
MSLSKLISKYSNNSIITLIITTIDSPVGKIVAAADDEFLYLVTFEDSKKIDKKLRALSKELPCNFLEGTNKVLKKLKHELSEYFKGNLKIFSVQIKAIGSDFQKQVWDQLQQVPYGTYQTYGDIAKSLGRSGNHSRAVGGACGANTHLLVVPCHRVVASNSKGGFSSGIDRKEWLLEHEKKYTT